MTSLHADHVTEYDCNIFRSVQPETVNLTAAGSDAVGPYPINWRVAPLWALVAAGVTGNTLVCASIVVERRLQNVTNYFLVSLAVADLFVSLVVMPCCIVQEIMGYWPFGLVMCDVWQLTDVVLCTSSIMHMCTISMDRYSAIRDPLHSRTEAKSTVAFSVKIAAVWLASILIGSPLIGLGALRPKQILNDQGECAIFNSYYLVYGSLMAFFGPLTIMLAAFSLTIRLLNQQSLRLSLSPDGGGMRRCTADRRSCKSTGDGSFRAAIPVSPATPVTRLTPVDNSPVPFTPSNSSADGKKLLLSAPKMRTSMRPAQRVNDETNSTSGQNGNCVNGKSGGSHSNVGGSAKSRQSRSDQLALTTSDRVDNEVNVGDENTTGGVISLQPGGTIQSGGDSATCCSSSSAAILVPVATASETAVGECDTPSCNIQSEVASNSIIDKLILPALTQSHQSSATLGTGSCAMTSSRSFDDARNGVKQTTSGLVVRRLPDIMYNTNNNNNNNNQSRIRNRNATVFERRTNKISKSPSLPVAFDAHPSEYDERTHLLADGEPADDVILRSTVTSRPLVWLTKMARNASVLSCGSHAMTSRVSDVRPPAQSLSCHVISGECRARSVAAAAACRKSNTLSGDICRIVDSVSSRDIAVESNHNSTSKDKAADERLVGDVAMTSSAAGSTNAEATTTIADTVIVSPVKFKSLVKKHGAVIKMTGMLVTTREDRQKKVFNSVKTERKAVKVLGIMFAIFCTCWAPFFTANLVMGICQTCHIDHILFKVFLWFGYASSTLNPIIYTVFNREFKNTFLRLLRCHCSAADGGAEGRVSQLQMLVRQNPHLVNGGAMLAIRALRPRGVATDNSTAH